MKTNFYKLTIMVGLCVFCFILMFNGNKFSARTNIEDLQQIANSVEQADGTIIEWSLYAREAVQDLDVDQYILQYPEMEWTVREDSVIGILNTDTYNETIQIMNNQQKDTPFISYELTGTDWDEATGMQASKIASLRMNTLFNGEPNLFSCIKGEFNNSIDEFTNHVMQSLQAKEIESIKEHKFRSISAYSSLFTQTLPLRDQQMNVQLGLRNNDLGNGTTFVIGTPILTIEY
ncbi:membrane protein [Bacillus sp. J14TS2]|uniref:YwmB family TATA-box binding protein n=1 Tax=Bacillus sp. J14TS2 TaxID=2807188 RepID=UPI001B2827C9|nr:YwmB family TATA-box binding protein [Bacillus sp. J14TS2]GIN69737.1 membrane protein [Bacillus sp. J14TS2]